MNILMIVAILGLGAMATAGVVMALVHLFEVMERSDGR